MVRVHFDPPVGLSDQLCEVPKRSMGMICEVRTLKTAQQEQSNKGHIAEELRGGARECEEEQGDRGVK